MAWVIVVDGATVALEHAVDWRQLRVKQNAPPSRLPAKHGGNPNTVPERMLSHSLENDASGYTPIGDAFPPPRLLEAIVDAHTPQLPTVKISCAVPLMHDDANCFGIVTPSTIPEVSINSGNSF